MPKIYDQKQDPDRGYKERKTLGEPGQPVKAENRTMILVIVAILAVVIILMVYRMARGEEIGTAVPDVSATVAMLLG